MPRPKLSDEMSLRNKLSFRVNDADDARIAVCATAAGLTTSEFVRRTVLSVSREMLATRVDAVVQDVADDDS